MSSEPKWTPGPWHWEMVDPECMALYGPEQEYHHVLWSQICPPCARRGNHCTAPNEHDAQLIATAPELYEALQEACVWDSHDAEGEPAVWLEKARAALEKARGES